MPIIERKTLDRVHNTDFFYLDAGNMIKAGHKAENNAGALGKFNVSVITVVNPTKEEKAQTLDSKLPQLIQHFIEKRSSENNEDLKIRLRETLSSMYVPFSENDQAFNIPGKKKYLSENELLTRKLESINFEQVSAGSSRLISKYKLKFAVDIIKEIQAGYHKLKPLEEGQKEQRGTMKRIHVNSIRLNSWYEDNRFRTMGDALINQAIDTALLYLHVFTNINKKRILEDRPMSDSRFDPSKRKSSEGIYQYSEDFITEAAVGILLHNIGYSHQKVHQIISGKQVLTPGKVLDDEKIKFIQRSLNVGKHLLDREDISSISRLICTMQKDYPDGTGFPAPNENKQLYEFIRLFHIVQFYDNMVNPVLTRFPYSRMDVIEYMKEHSGEYKYTGEKFSKQPLFDSRLLKEFLSVLAPYDKMEKVYLYEKGNHNQQLFVGKVISYPNSHFPLISILKDERKGKEYRDGSLFMHIPSSSMLVNKGEKTERIKMPWISKVEIFDRKVDAGEISGYKDPVFGGERAIHKRYR